MPEPMVVVPTTRARAPPVVRAKVPDVFGKVKVLTLQDRLKITAEL